MCWSSDVCSSDLAAPEAGLAVGRSFEAVARADAAAQQVQRQEQRTEHHVLVDVRALVVGEHDRRFVSVACIVCIGLARRVERIARVQDHVAQRDRAARAPRPAVEDDRSEEHTSELQSLMRISYAVFCLTKKTNTIYTHHKLNTHT